MEMRIQPLCDREEAPLPWPREQVDLWQAWLDRSPAAIARLRDLLSPRERERCDRYLRESDRHRAIVSRGLLRQLLGRYLGVCPSAVPIQVEAGGKPMLAGQRGEPLCFNVSHSDGLALYAVTVGRRLGVDLERFREVPDMDGLVGRFFSPLERQAFFALPLPQRKVGFFNAWTRKEAFLKALGTGIHDALDAFTVTLAPDEPARLVQCALGRTDPEQWTMHGWIPEPGFVAALAVEAPGRTFAAPANVTGLSCPRVGRCECRI